jgi:uncharacterized membrane protein YhiD involved in acid resistance
MGTEETFRNFLTSQAGQLSALEFTLNLAFAIVLATGIAFLYIRYGGSLSNRRSFGPNLITLTMITVLVISIVKSSLALSLGLVGALSIVRFRTPVKEPEELMFLFLAIGIGIGIGANQVLITTIAVLFCAVVIILISRYRKTRESRNLHITIRTSELGTLTVGSLSEVVAQWCEAVQLRRFDDAGGALEATFLVEFENIDSIDGLVKALGKLDQEISVSFLDTQNLSL